MEKGRILHLQGEMDKETQSILGAMLGSGGLAVTILKLIEKWVDHRRQKASGRAILGGADIYEAMNKYLDATKAERVLLLYTSNGGGIPSPARPVYCSILYEVKNPNLNPIRSLFQQMPLDQGYTSMLKEVIVNGQADFNIEDMPEGFLKDLYLSEGVISSRITEVHRTEERYYYLSARWDDVKKIPAEFALNVETRATVTVIQKILKQG